jgi:hypothetical protein
MNKEALIEAAKEVGRWIVLSILSWFITETLNQVVMIPSTYELRVWVFVYSIPLRFLFQTGLTLLGRAIDKYLYKLPNWSFWTDLLGKKKLDGLQVSDGLLPF